MTWTWATAGDAGGGAAWCSTCLGPEQLRMGAAVWLVQGVEGGAPRYRAHAAELRAQLRAAGHAVLQGVTGLLGAERSYPLVSEWGACPLCGLGEGGGEHLVIWCPAVAAAWLELSNSPVALSATLCSREAAQRGCAADLVHQASFLHGSLYGRAAMTWEAASGWLVQAVRCLGEAASEHQGLRLRRLWRRKPPRRHLPRHWCLYVAV